MTPEEMFQKLICETMDHLTEDEVEEQHLNEGMDRYYQSNEE